MLKQSKQELVAVLFTDIEGFSLISNNDQEVGLQMAQVHHEVIESRAADFSGECINFYGDGSLSIFHSAKDAVLSAIEMQKAFRSETEIPVRIGIHIGEVIRDENSAYGDAVNIASRIQSLASKGSILVSEAVKKALGEQKGIELKSIGREYLKNIPAPVNLFYVTHPQLAIPSKEEVQAKAQEQSSGHSERGKVSKLILFGALITVLSLFYYFLQKEIQPTIPESVYKERLAVLPFENQTGIPADSNIGQWVAAIISSSLQELEGTQVISYSTLDGYQPTAEAGFFSNSRVPKITGAINMIEGQYFKEGDSILFKSMLRNVKGVYLHAFKAQKSRYIEPEKAVGKLDNHIKGYWASQDFNILNPPNYDAWMHYLFALRLWNGNGEDTTCEKYLDKSIQADSTFFDAYLLKLDIYKNSEDYDRAKSWHELIKKKFPPEKLKIRQQNMISFDQAELEGKNILAYQHFLKEYEYNRKDLFNSIQMAILALECVNDPAAAQEILSSINRDSIEYFTCDYCLQRLDIDLRSQIDLGNFEEAYKIIDLYPRPIEDLSRNQMVLRAYLANNDTSSFDSKLNALKFELDRQDLAAIQYLMAKDAGTLGMERLSKSLASAALMYYKTRNSRRTTELHLLLGEEEEALQTSTTRLEKNSNRIRDQILIAISHARLSNPTEAYSQIVEIEKKMETNKLEFGYNPYYISHIYTALGETEKALEKIQSSIDQGRKFNRNTFHWDVYLKPLHQLEDFQNIIHPMR